MSGGTLRGISHPSPKVAGSASPPVLEEVIVIFHTLFAGYRWLFAQMPLLVANSPLALASCSVSNGPRAKASVLGPNSLNAFRRCDSVFEGYRVRFTTAAALVNELLEARDDKRLLRVQKQLAKQDLLIVDELGYVPLSKTGSELLFEIFSQRYEQAPCANDL